MMIAYLILAHKHPKQLKKLVSVLAIGDCHFFIHIDKKSDFSLFENEIKSLGLHNVEFIEQNNVQWASISQTEARIRLIEAALGGEQTYSHLVMLSGQTYPIRPVNDFLDFLQSNSDTTFMEHFPLPYNGIANGGLDRTECYTYTIWGKRITHFKKGFYTTFNLKGKIINFLLSIVYLFRKNRIFPSYLKAYYGIDWWVLTHNAASYIIKFIRKHPDYHLYHKYTRHTSEIYFPSILAGSDFTGKIVNDSLHFMIWHDHTAKHPDVITVSDIPELKKANAFFARKFDVEKDDSVFFEIDKHLLNICHE